jgi:hypothetical protein
MQGETGSWRRCTFAGKRVSAHVARERNFTRERQP